MPINEAAETASLRPQAVTALRNEEQQERQPLARAPSMDMKAEREDLKTAAEHSLNVILDLGKDGCIRWVSPSWKDVIGTLPEDVKGKPIADLLLTSKDAFATTLDTMRSDDSKSRIVRFKMGLGPHSVLQEIFTDGDVVQKLERPEQEGKGGDEHIVNLKGRGILVHDRSSGGESHV